MTKYYNPDGKTFHKGDRVLVVRGHINNRVSAVENETGTIESTFGLGAYNVTLDRNQETYHFADAEIVATGEDRIAPPAPTVVSRPKPVKDTGAIRSNAANKAWATRRAAREEAAARLSEAVQS